MTEPEQRLADDTARATIAKLNAETARTQKLTSAEYAKMIAEAGLLARQERWTSPKVWVPIAASLLALAKSFGYI